MSLQMQNSIQPNVIKSEHIHGPITSATKKTILAGFSGEENFPKLLLDFSWWSLTMDYNMVLLLLAMFVYADKKNNSNFNNNDLNFLLTTSIGGENVKGLICAGDGKKLKKFTMSAKFQKLVTYIASDYLVKEEESEKTKIENKKMDENKKTSKITAIELKYAKKRKSKLENFSKCFANRINKITPWKKNRDNIKNLLEYVFKGEAKIGTDSEQTPETSNPSEISRTAEQPEKTKTEELSSSHDTVNPVQPTKGNLIIPFSEKQKQLCDVTGKSEKELREALLVFTEHIVGSNYTDSIVSFTDIWDQKLVDRVYATGIGVEEKFKKIYKFEGQYQQLIEFLYKLLHVDPGLKQELKTNLKGIKNTCPKAKKNDYREQQGRINSAYAVLTTLIGAEGVAKVAPRAAGPQKTDEQIQAERESERKTAEELSAAMEGARGKAPTSGKVKNSEQLNLIASALKIENTANLLERLKIFTNTIEGNLQSQIPITSFLPEKFIQEIDKAFQDKYPRCQLQIRPGIISVTDRVVKVLYELLMASDKLDSNTLAQIKSLNPNRQFLNPFGKTIQGYYEQEVRINKALNIIRKLAGEFIPLYEENQESVAGAVDEGAARKRNAESVAEQLSRENAKFRETQDKSMEVTVDLGGEEIPGDFWDKPLAVRCPEFKSETLGMKTIGGLDTDSAEKLKSKNASEEMIKLAEEMIKRSDQRIELCNGVITLPPYVNNMDDFRKNIMGEKSQAPEGAKENIDPRIYWLLFTHQDDPYIRTFLQILLQKYYRKTKSYIDGMMNKMGELKKAMSDED